jgi:AmiR/NasT family two-component response regulator
MSAPSTDPIPIGRSVLVVADNADELNSTSDDLNRVGMRVVGAVQCLSMVQSAMRLSPDVVIAMVPAPGPAFFAAAENLASSAAVPLGVFTQDPRIEMFERALASGVHNWVVRGYAPERLLAVAQQTVVRFRRESAHAQSLRQLATRLDERKLIDRAKGILMGAGGMDEEDAFRAIRSAAMHDQQRVGQVSQRLIAAARDAESINRAGQLRMLSQRLVKLRLLAALGVETAGAQALTNASGERVRQNLDALQELLSHSAFGKLLDGANQAWRRLHDALGMEVPVALRALDAAGEDLLHSAEHLTNAIGAANPMARARIINLAGRQRMLSQRIAKLALFDVLEGESGRERRSEQERDAREAFDAALQELRASPLTDPAARAELESATRCWRALRACSTIPVLPSRAIQIARDSEEVLERFDAMTEGLGRKIEVLLVG